MNTWMRLLACAAITTALGACGGSSTPDVGTDDAQDVALAETGADAATDIGADAATDIGADAATDVPTDVASDVALDAATDAGADASADTGTDARPDVGSDATPTDANSVDGGLAVLCTATGGTVSSSLCCASASDFPSSCATGACGCAPSSSHMVQTCQCASGRCFDPARGCVTP